MLKDSDWLLSPHDSSGFVKFEKVAEHSSGGQRSWTEYLHFRIAKRYGLVNITDLAEEVLARSGVRDGLCYVGAMHITAGIYVNDAESGLLQDISRWIEKLAPFGENYKHHQTGEDNGDAHLKSYLTNHQIIVPVTKGRFDFGTWQQIFYAEFDGLRDKRVLVKVVGLT
jgi:secondary thiamine-phosphate synthase enzyme